MVTTAPVDGLSSLAVTVQSVQGNVALVRDQTGRQFQVRRDFQRAKGPWPEPNEQWLVDRAYGNEWMFCLLITPSQTPLGRPAVIVVASLAARDAIASPAAGQMILRTDTNTMDYFDGVIWHGTKVVTTQTVTILNPNTTVFDDVAKVATLGMFDPGWPYFLKFYGHLGIQVGSSCGIDIQFRDGDGLTGPIINDAIYSIDGRNPSNQNGGTDPLGSSTFPISLAAEIELHGARTVSIVFSKWLGGPGDGWLVRPSNLSKVYADITPL